MFDYLILHSHVAMTVANYAFVYVPEYLEARVKR